MKIIFLMMILGVHSVGIASDCQSFVDTLLKIEKRRLNGETGERARLASQIRSMARNIIEGKLDQKKNDLGYSRARNLFFSEYSSTESGYSITLIFNERASISAYKVTGNGETYYKCLDQRSVNSVKKIKKIRKSRKKK